MNSIINEEVQRTLGLGKYKFDPKRNNRKGSNKSRKEQNDEDDDNYNPSSKGAHVYRSRKKLSISKRGLKKDGSNCKYLFFKKIFFLNN